MRLKKQNIFPCGFTLVEMLVVVAIIGILAALLLPSLRRSLATARTVECAHNMKQYANTAILFANDHDGIMPLWVYTIKKSGFENVLFPEFDQVGGPNRGWYTKTTSNLFWPYIESLRFAYCRDNPKANEVGVASLDLSWQIYTTIRAPCAHFSQTNTYSGSTHPIAKRLNRAPHPSRLFLWLDANDPAQGLKFDKDWDVGAYANIGWYHNQNSGFNACFFDGHVEFKPLNYTPMSRLDPPLVKDNWE